MKISLLILALFTNVFCVVNMMFIVLIVCYALRVLTKQLLAGPPVTALCALGGSPPMPNTMFECMNFIYFGNKSCLSLSLFDKVF